MTDQRQQCERCSEPFNSNGATTADPVEGYCPACQSEIRGLQQRVNNVVATATARTIRNLSGFDLSSLADLLVFLDEADDGDLIAIRIIGKKPGDEE